MIVTLEKLSKLNLEGKIVLCHGVFDVIHAGHIQQFEQARKLGDTLIVSLTPDKYVKKGPGRPIFNQDLRAAVVDSIKWVDLVVINDTPDAMDVLNAIKPSIYCKGEEVLDCPSKHIAKERKFVESYDGEVILLEMVGDLSSSKVINQTTLSPDLAAVVEEIKVTTKYSNIEQYFAELKNLQILVIGEYIRDEYVLCEALNRSSKDVMVPMRYLSEEVYNGGAAVVASNIAQFCDNVGLVTAGGDFQLNGVGSYIVCHPTIRKRRLIEEGTGSKVSELVYLDEDYGSVTRDSIKQGIDLLIGGADVVVVCDYGHGFFTQDFIDCIVKRSQFLAVNAQTNSANYGYNLATRWYGANYAVVDEKELRLACGDRTKAIGDLVANLTISDILIVTLGHKGSVAYQEGEYIRYFPPISSSVVDTVGAGDAFLSITAPLIALGVPLDVVGLLGNAYGAMKVSIFGNKPVDSIEFKKFIKGILA